MEIHVDARVSRAAVGRVHRAVSEALGARTEPDVRVYVSRPRPGRWSVFITGLSEHPLAVAESIETTLAAGDQ